ncbi:MAG TPA: glycosyl hydrolase 108 family protein [Stellaceae bacterium]|nr:glycosyl hydrolase 108 family protein [Stellaceae bacterium]
MSAAFLSCIPFVLAEEGGLSTDPGDPGNWTGGSVGGGECLGTNFGIASADYQSFLAALPASVAATMPATVASLTVAQAQTIYQSLFWTPIQGDQLPLALAMVMLDAAVNSGVSQSGMWLQTVIGVATDGVIGPETLASVKSWIAARGTPTTASATGDLCAEVIAQRIAALGTDPDFSTFGLGWSRRCAALAFQAATMS